jgi:peptidoglycan-associated lipoprotein
MNRGVSVTAVIALVTALGVSACGKKPPAPAPAPPPPPPTAPATTPTAPPPPPAAPRETPPPTLTEEEIFAKTSVADLNAQKPLAPVFFALDSHQLGDDSKPIMQKNADWMKKWTSTRIMIEGHCDSRGTAEYNLALGERRAVAVRDYLVNLGIPATRIQIVSKGKESGFCSEQSEACWQQNRRGHFIITAK